MGVSQPDQAPVTPDIMRGAPTFPLRHRLRRVGWILAWWLLARWTPPPLHRWRRLLLRLFGAQLHPTARVYASARIWDPARLAMGRDATLGPRVDCYTMAAVTLGDEVVVSQDACLCTGSHDIDVPGFDLVTRPIVIAAQAWIAAGAFVGPGVAVGEGAVLGARAVALRDLAPWTVYIGSPATAIRQRRRC